MARLELQGVGHSYAGSEAPVETWAVQPLDLVWDDGLTHALLGSSGCGKTTLLTILSGLLKPTVGRVLIDGRDVTDEPPRARNIAQVFQFPVVYDSMTVADNLAFPLRNRRVPERSVAARVAEVAELLELTDVAADRARGLPAEMRQRLSLGRGLVRTDVAAVLLDEPLTQVDPALRWTLRRRLRVVQAQLRPTMIYVTHDQDEALTLADSVVVMDAGAVLQVGTPVALHERPANTAVARFIGSPGMNLLPARTAGGRVWWTGLEQPLELSLDAAVGHAGEGEVVCELGIRPDRVRRVRSGESAHNAVRATVTRVEDLGHRRLVGLEIGAHPLVMETEDAGAPGPGEVLQVALPADDLRVFVDGQAAELGADGVTR